MNKISKIAIVIVLIAAVGAVLAIKKTNSVRLATDIPAVTDTQNTAKVVVPADGNHPEALPRLVDIGAKTCIPCKMMAPILEQLKTEYAGRLKVEFLDVRENPDLAREYNVMVIPLQIFYDTNGKELFRHEGFFSKADILNKWKEFGFNFDNPK